MSESQELIVIPTETAMAVFSADDGLQPYLAKIRAELDAFTPDVSTKKGRDAIASIAHKVARSKTYLDGVGKDLVAELKELPKKIDASRKHARDTLDAWKDEVRRPLTEWEEAEAARVQAHQDAIARLRALGTDLHDLCSADLLERKEQAEAVELGDHWEEFAAEAGLVKDKTVSSLTHTLEAAQRREYEAAKLARLRAEEDARRQREHEERIAQEAAERAQAEAEARAQAEREAAARREREAAEAAERRELELRLAAEKAERERLEAIARAEQAEIAARQKAEREAAEAAQRERDEAARREADKTHRASINRAAMSALVAGGMSEESARLAVELIAKRAIPNVTIAY